MLDQPALTPWPRRPARLATAVIEELADRIVGGQFAPGATLPTEPALCEAFGVSRSVLREATKALEAMRLVKVQQGQGTTALPLSEWDLAHPVVLAAVIRHDDELAILDNLVDVRCALESQMAARAAVAVTDEQQSMIDARLADLDRFVDDAERFAAADIAFHEAIHTASGNMLGRAMIKRLTQEAYRSLRYIGEPTNEQRRITNQGHHRIRDAVAARNPDGAAEAMTRHISEAWEMRKPGRK